MGLRVGGRLFGAGAAINQRRLHDVHLLSVFIFKKPCKPVVCVI